MNPKGCERFRTRSAPLRKRHAAKRGARIEIRRCRPLLGTFVEIAVTGTSAEKLERALAGAFASVEQAHRLMSFYDPASDIARINRQAFQSRVVVHPWTWRVLQAAQRFARESSGVFDPTAARPGHGNWADIVLEKNCAVRLRRRVTIDLGGIAKGFAVDRAVAALRKRNVRGGIVNAGGDLRVFGAAPRTVLVRNPRSPGEFSARVRVRNLAIASSATCFAPDALFDGRTRRHVARLLSVTIAARDCMTADALAKIVFTLRENAAPVLRRYRAHALILDRTGLPCWVFKTHAG